MITAVHSLVYSDDPEATRAFFRDVLGWRNVDAHGGWLIFRTGPSELGVHPSSGTHDGQAWSTPAHHEISLMCDDLEATMAELSARGASFSRQPAEESFGRTVPLVVPGSVEILLYEPSHATAYDL